MRLPVVGMVGTLAGTHGRILILFATCARVGQGIFLRRGCWNRPDINWLEQFGSMQYGASASLIHVALLCGAIACLSSSNAMPFLLRSLTYNSTIRSLSCLARLQLPTRVFWARACDRLAHPALFMALADVKAPQAVAYLQLFVHLEIHYESARKSDICFNQ